MHIHNVEYALFHSTLLIGTRYILFKSTCKLYVLLVFTSMILNVSFNANKYLSLIKIKSLSICL